MQYVYTQSTVDGPSGVRGASALWHVTTAQKHAQGPVTIPRPNTGAMIAKDHMMKQVPVWWTHVPVKHFIVDVNLIIESAKLAFIIKCYVGEHKMSF